MRIQLLCLAIGIVLSIGDARAPIYFPWWRIHVTYYFFLTMMITPYRKAGILCLFLLWLLHWQSGTFFEIMAWTIAAVSLASLYEVVNRLAFFPLLLGTLVITGSTLLSHYTSSPLLNLASAFTLSIVFYGFFTGLSSTARTHIHRV